MTQRDSDRRAALGWIAGQLAWENRLETLRDEPEDAPVPEQVAEATEINSAA
jgi:hypothetical protein